MLADQNRDLMMDDDGHWSTENAYRANKQTHLKRLKTSIFALSTDLFMASVFTIF